jgi:inner membrane protein
MATAFTHGMVGLVAGRIVFRQPMPARFWLLAAACSALPDADVALHAYGVDYADLWGHRGMTHSVFFAAALAAVITCLFFRPTTPRYAVTWFSARWWKLFAFFSLVTASHGFIDGFTDGGLGIAYFSPFDTGRSFMPWRPLAVPGIGLDAVFTGRMIHVLLTEFAWVWLPAGLLLVTLEAGALVRRGLQSAGTPDDARGE